jgi:tetratricopeptide (TPR) repeat protein
MRSFLECEMWSAGSSTRRPALRAAAAGCLALAISACSATAEGRVAQADKMLRAGDVEAATEMLEASEQSMPASATLRVALCRAYFAGAQRAFEAGNEAEYTSLLEQAQEQCLGALELDRQRADAHNMLGILSAYRGGMKGARDSFDIARKLDPRNPVYSVNLAEVYVYLGEQSFVRTHLQRGRKLGGSPAQIDLVEVLHAWKYGDMNSARDTFADVKLLDPEETRTWNGATSIETFEGFTAHCCALPICGPYMRGACAAMQHRVEEREVQAETARRELLMEMERARRVREIYRDGMEVEITTEPPSGEEAPTTEPEPGGGRPERPDEP